MRNCGWLDVVVVRFDFGPKGGLWYTGNTVLVIYDRLGKAKS